MSKSQVSSTVHQIEEGRLIRLCSIELYTYRILSYTMVIVKVAFLLLTGISISLCDVEYDQYIKHFTTVKQFTCGNPQPRAFLIEEVITADFVKDKRKNVR